MHLAATPAWFADNFTQVVFSILVVVAVLVLWVAQTRAVRFTLLAVIAVVAVVVYLNRVPLETCARTCECQLAGHDVTVPSCDSDTHV